LKEKKKACVKPKFLYYSEGGEEKKIPIGQYQKAGWTKPLPLFLKIRVKGRR